MNGLTLLGRKVTDVIRTKITWRFVYIFGLFPNMRKILLLCKGSEDEHICGEDHMKFLSIIVPILVLSLFTSTAYSHGGERDANGGHVDESTGIYHCHTETCVVPPEPPELSRDWTSIEIVLSVALLLFTLILFALEALIIMRASKTWAPLSILRLLGLTLIVCIATLLVVAGYGKDQIAPVTGLLGVIAGYLLGTNETKQSAT